MILYVGVHHRGTTLGRHGPRDVLRHSTATVLLTSAYASCGQPTDVSSQCDLDSANAKNREGGR